VTIERACVLAAALALASCSVNGGSASVPQQAERSLRRAAASPITHVVFVIQENRSFNNLFLGYPNATTQSFGYDTYGNKIQLQPIDLATQWDLDHSSNAFFTDCAGIGSLPGTDCRMNGWNKEVLGLHAPHDGAYGYVPRSETKPYWDIAKQYVLADDTYGSNLDASFVAHQYAVAAYSASAVNGPDGLWGCEGGKGDTTPTLTQQRAIGKSIVACFTFPTLADEADAAGVTWRFYAVALGQNNGDIWSSFQADSNIYNGPDWSKDVINPPSQFLTDVGNGKLANITWIAPTYPTSDHPGVPNGTEGPAWVASVVNAIGKSKFWKSTAIFVFWDDWGGWFDPVQPVLEDYDGLGFRVPLMIVSPYAKKGSVTHVQYETSSVLRYIEDNFGLGQLAPSDTRANDPADDPAALDYAQAPRKFRKIQGSEPTGFWIRLDGDARARQTPRIIGDD
jgi:phospholipase C